MTLSLEKLVCMGKKMYCIIPARGGSKRIKRKNVKQFLGVPAITRAVMNLKSMSFFTDIFVTTDDNEIKNKAQAAGAKVPFLRSASLSNDQTPTKPVISDAIVRLNLHPDDMVFCTYPTAFFLQRSDLEAALAKLEAGSKWVLALAKYASPIERAFVEQDGNFVPNKPVFMSKRTQDLTSYFYDVGQFYGARAKDWVDDSQNIWDHASAVVVPRHCAVDIDTDDDWKYAEALFKVNEQT